MNKYFAVGLTFFGLLMGSFFLNRIIVVEHFKNWPSDLTGIFVAICLFLFFIRGKKKK